MGLSFLLMPVNRGNEAHVLCYRQVLFAAPLVAPMHQTGAPKTAYKRLADLGWYLPITGKRPPASHSLARRLRADAPNVAARHNNDITFENKSSPSQSEKRR
jgi:hypothetical protein